jgi:hypothetical protein
MWQSAKISVSEDWTKLLPVVDTMHVEKYVELWKGLNMVARMSIKPNSDAR